MSTPSSNIHLSNSPQHLSVSGFGTTDPSTVDYDSSDDESALGGDSVLAAHTNFASEFLENAVERTSLQDVSPEMHEALASLRQLVKLQSRQSISHGPRFPMQQAIPQGGLGQLPLPPMDLVVTLLKRVRGTDVFSQVHLPRTPLRLLTGLRRSFSTWPLHLHLLLYRRP